MQSHPMMAGELEVLKQVATIKHRVARHARVAGGALRKEAARQ
jgi:hypothetical protein